MQNTFVRRLTSVSFVLGIACGLLAGTSAVAQQLPPYNGPAAEGLRTGHFAGQGSTFTTPGVTYYNSTIGYGALPYTCNWGQSFYGLGWGGLNYYYGPVGGCWPTVYAPATVIYPAAVPYYVPYTVQSPVVQAIPQNGLADGAPANPEPRPQRPAARLARLPAQPPQADVPIAPHGQGNDALTRSLRLQKLGDEYFAKQDYLQAYGNYKQAMSIAPTRVEPRFRMAISLAATSHFGQAVDEMKRGLRKNPDWPRTGANLDDLFGADSILAKNATLHRVANWVREDIRDPDRLFLMGVLLHFNDDPDKSRPFLEAAVALSPTPMYAQAFLDSADQEPPRPGLDVEDHAAVDPDLPVPDPVQKNVPAPARAPAPARINGPLIPGLPRPQQNADPVFRGKKKPAPEEPRPKPLARHDQPRDLLHRLLTPLTGVRV